MEMYQKETLLLKEEEQKYAIRGHEAQSYAWYLQNIKTSLPTYLLLLF